MAAMSTRIRQALSIHQPSERCQGQFESQNGVSFEALDWGFRN